MWTEGPEKTSATATAIGISGFAFANNHLAKNLARATAPPWLGRCRLAITIFAFCCFLKVFPGHVQISRALQWSACHYGSFELFLPVVPNFGSRQRRGRQTGCWWFRWSLEVHRGFELQKTLAEQAWHCTFGVVSWWLLLLRAVCWRQSAAHEPPANNVLASARLTIFHRTGCEVSQLVRQASK